MYSLSIKYIGIHLLHIYLYFTLRRNIIIIFGEKIDTEAIAKLEDQLNSIDKDKEDIFLFPIGKRKFIKLNKLN